MLVIIYEKCQVTTCVMRDSNEKVNLLTPSNWIKLIFFFYIFTLNFLNQIYRILAINS